MQLNTSGAELITNAADRDFSSDTGFWTKGVGWTISDGAANFNTSGVSYFRKDNIVTIKKVYVIEVTAIITSGCMPDSDNCFTLC